MGLDDRTRPMVAGRVACFRAYAMPPVRNALPRSRALISVSFTSESETPSGLVTGQKFTGLKL